MNFMSAKQRQDQKHYLAQSRKGAKEKPQQNLLV